MTDRLRASWLSSCKTMTWQSTVVGRLQTTSALAPMRWRRGRWRGQTDMAPPLLGRG